MLLRRRPRRMRKAHFVRELVAETSLRPSDFVWPLFVHDQSGTVDVEMMPGVQCLDVDALLGQCARASELGLPMVALFPRIAESLKTPDGREARNRDGLIPRCIRAVKREYPDLGVMADIALDPYTSHGHDGLLSDTGEIRNDESVAELAFQALALAEAGADVVAPSDMMDGRIGAIRDTLEHAGHTNTAIMSYAVKYASAFYRPFRDAVGTNALLRGDKRTYQMDPRNRHEARLEAELDLEQGADMLMVKPGMPYLDVVRDLAERSPVPVFAYQVSGEYAMIAHAAAVGMIEREAAMIETLTAFRRAGAAGVLTYFAPEAAALLAG